MPGIKDKNILRENRKAHPSYGSSAIVCFLFVGFTAVLWEQVQRTAGSHGDVAKNRLLHPGRNKENRPRRPGKRKRLDQDETSKAKLKCTSLTDTLRKKG